MKSFSSSAINKSGKKFAPKAPARRAAPAAPPRRPSVTSQPSASQTPQPAADTATPEPGPPASTTAPEPSVPVEPPAPEPSAARNVNAIPPPSATAIPIPRPKRKASFSAAAPTVSHDVPAPQPTPPSPSALPAEPTTLPPAATATDTQIQEKHPKVQAERNDRDEPLVPKPCPTAEAVATEIRPSKRPKTTPETTTTDAESSSATTPQLMTPPATQNATIEGATEDLDNTDSIAPDQSRKTAKPRNRKASKDTSSENAAKKKERKPRTRKKREPTPEGAETVEIAPAVIKMSELCKDMRTGKKSKRETELRKLELAELERKQAEQQEGGSVDQAPKQDDGPPPAPEDGLLDKKAQSGPVMRIVNGEIVLDTASLQVDRHADAARNGGDLEDVVENSLTRKINQSTYGRRTKTESWDEDMTDLFYRGLRMFGTDFMVISKLFPGRSRRQIKLKFNNEERRDPERIKETLMGPRESIDINTYSEMTNTVYDDPKVIQQELDEEKKRIEDQHALEKQAQEDLLHNPDGAAGAAEPDKAGAPVKGKRSKKQARAADGGQEEILGSIDD